ncbi:hypothetical protein [Listeria booriae]|uniref:hypothetical protein n=1 Tax=Listeria booriae TaxID=1552123 RepID=UPI001625696A|nr:hypothetical protein [Listeria booriae]MBC2163879.1 hypothetical protein [Listeria booriae]
MKEGVFTNGVWYGTSFSLNMDEEQTGQLIKILGIKSEDYNFNDGVLEIDSCKNLLFLDVEYVNEVSEFEDFLDNYTNKSFEGLKYFSKSKMNVFPIKFSSKKIQEDYNVFIDNNNIDLKNIDKERVKIPPDLFHKLNKMYIEYEIVAVDCLNYLTELFSLFAIAEKSKLKGDGDNIVFEFWFTGENKKSHVLEVPWKEWGYFKNDTFYKCYAWIITKKNEGFKIETLLDVLRQFFESLADISKLEDVTSSLDSVLKRILLYETKLYFEQQNKLRDEFIKYQKMELDAKSSVMKSLLGLITTVGLAYYGRISLLKDFKIADKNRDIGILFIFAMIAIVFFAFIFWVNYAERRRYYISLRKIYTEKFAFSANDFDSIVEKPSLIKKQWTYWITLIVFGGIIGRLIYFYW